MQERIPEYVAMLKVKNISTYETPARVCAEYFDGRGIDTPSDSDWEAFKEYYREEYQREKGKDISETTLQQNYVRRGKAFYRWCNGEQTASLFEDKPTEAANNPAEAIEGKKQSDTSGSETEKAVRTSLLIDAKTYRLLAMLAALEDKTMTEILTAGAHLYIKEHSHEAAKLQEAIDARSK